MSADENGAGSAKIVHLRTGIEIPDPEKPDERLVKYLRKLLAEAESGDLRAVCVIGLYSDGMCGDRIRGLWDSIRLIGQLEMTLFGIKRDRQLFLDEAEEEPAPTG